MESALDKHTKSSPVTLTETDCKALLQQCENLITDICEECNYDHDNIKPTNWGYIVSRIGQEIFKPVHYIVQEENTPGQYKGGRYLDDNMLLLYDNVFLPLCMKYGQIVSTNQFFRFISVEMQMISHEWERRGKLTSSSINLRQRLTTDREQTLSAAMLSSGHNPVKFLAIGNHEFGWNETQRAKPIQQRQQIALDDVPELTGIELTDNRLLPDFGNDDN